MMKTEQLPLPTNLEHEPLRAVPYIAHDGKWAGDTDAQHLSLGRAQWNAKDLSAKVFRHVKTRWSRQSEELPVHRAIDLTIFIALALFGKGDDLPAGTLENQRHPLGMRPSSAPSDESLTQKFPGDIGRAKARLQKLREVLNDLRQIGAI